MNIVFIEVIFLGAGIHHRIERYEATGLTYPTVRETHKFNNRAREIRFHQLQSERGR